MAPASIRKGVVAALRLHACAVAGACSGLLAGWFGLAAGLIMGAMLDAARLEARSRARVSAFLSRPEGDAPPEPLEGFSAAACLALRGEWPGLADRDARRALFERLSWAALPPAARARREAERVVDVAARCALPDLPSLAKRLATSDADIARRLLAAWAFALAAIGRTRLEPGPELALRAALGDCGLGARERGSGPSPARATPGRCWASLPALPRRKPSARTAVSLGSCIPTPSPATTGRGSGNCGRPTPS
jgi:hypothetical protein